MVRSGTGGIEQGIEGASGALRSERIAQQPAVLVEGKQDAVHVKRELLRIGVVAEMSLGDPAAENPRDRLA